MSKRLLCLLLSAVMILGMLPGVFVGAAEEDTQATKFVGKADFTGGNWVGKFGEEGYILPYYTVYEYFQPLVDAEDDEWTFNGRYIPKGGVYPSGRSYMVTLDTGASLVNKPSYVSSLWEDGTGNGYWVDATRFKPTTNTLAPQDPRAGATTRNLTYVSSGSTMHYGFKMNDDAWHYITVYAVDYSGKASATYSVIEGTSAAATPIASYSATVEELAAGVYMTFQVRATLCCALMRLQTTITTATSMVFSLTLCRLQAMATRAASPVPPLPIKWV